MVGAVITGKTKLLGIIGYPVEHSLSPAMQNAAVAQMGLDYIYVPFSVHPDHLKDAIAGFTATPNLVGFNITIPHKQAIIPLLSEVSDFARAVGAVNTVWRTENGWSGTNTDVEGFLAPLLNLTSFRGTERNLTPQPPLRGTERNLTPQPPLRGTERNLTPKPPLRRTERGSESVDWSQTIAVVLGGGGAARAVVAGCAKLGCAEIRVFGRNQQNLNEFLESWRHSPLRPNLYIHAWEQIREFLPQTTLLVNTTPVGMHPHVEQSPVDAAVIAELKQGAIAYDLIYNPRPTLFLQQAQAQGAIAIDGLEMLVQQGAVALRTWLQRPEVPVDIMRQTLQAHLAGSD